MSVNSKKCKVISFSHCNRPIPYEYCMETDLLERVMSICDLGVTIDTKLRFNEHLGTTAAEAVSWNTYAAPVWCPYYTTQILTIERVQRKFIRFALRQLPWNDPTNPTTPTDAF